MRMVVSRTLAVILLFIAFFFIAKGSWIKIKPLVAGVLLEKAWEQTVEGGKPVKPWPWADTWPIARITIDRLGIDSVVLEGDSGEVLAFGPGHVSGSAQPLGKGNCVLVGHRDTSFKFLQHLRPGDRITLDNRQKQRKTYRIDSLQVMSAEKLHFREIEESWLTFITCYPFGAIAPGGKQRFVVFARVIEGV